MSDLHPYIGIVHLPADFSVRKEALGLAWEIVLGDQKATLTLPVYDGTRLTCLENGAALNEHLRRVDPIAWGHKYSVDLFKVRAVAIALPLTPVDSIGTSQEFKNAGEAFLQWFGIVQEWAAAWLGVTVKKLGGSRENVISLDTGGGILGTGAKLVTVMFNSTHGLPLVQVKGAFDRASRGEHAPPEYRLLESAQVAGIEGDPRRAVIDAGTAAEVALASAIAADLGEKGLAQGFIEAAIKNANGVVGLRDLYTSLGHALSVSRNRLMNELANVRNTAAHGGKVPTHDETAHATQHARALVKEARPLPPC